MNNNLPIEQAFPLAGTSGKCISNQDWSAHPLGSVNEWPFVLRANLSTALCSGFASFVAWGPQFYTFYNDEYARVLGDKASLGQGLPLTELWPEISHVVQSLAQEAFAGTTQHFEDRPFVLQRHGYAERTYFTFCFSPVHDKDGLVGGILGTLVETTEKVAALSRIQESDERYRLALEASGNIGTWVVDPETNVTSMDERFATLFEVDLQVAQKGTDIDVFTDRIHPEDRSLVEAAVAEAIKNGERYDIDYRIKQRSGKVVWVTAKGKMFSDARSGQQRFAGVAVEITEQKQMEEALLENDRRKDEFLAMLAHELRNPLAPIMAAAEVLRLAQFDEARVKQTSEIISRQGRHMTSLIDDLLDVSRVTRGLVTLDTIDLDAKRIVSEAVEQVRPLIEVRRHHIAVHICPESSYIRGDSKRLVQVVANLLNNATKYTPEGGAIDLKLAVRSDTVMITVEDNGIGMASDYLSKVFDMFSQAQRTTDRSQGGLGIGLSLAKSLVEKHGGSVKAESAGLGQGSRFTVSLPRISVSTTEIEIQPDRSDSIRHSGLRIMVVDDNVDAATMLAMFLEAEGHQVIVEHDSRRALELARGNRLEAFLLDIGLPYIDGNELARRLRAQPESASSLLIAVTGYGQEQDKRSTSAAGFDHHLVKPVDMTQLALLLANLAQKNVAGRGRP
ncbi:ATP-binding protein [Duganella sp. Leaf61]|uniref:hybrid sensor histidine kinase/response regulator n=1 Tax=Duganella sp. Leaf61 TaxID=1736227 RepID=UPI001E570DC7|nr:ATP-binding protein [Duganella sp. Leaf61]